MPRANDIPDCPVFRTVTVAGVTHTLTPTPRNLDCFLAPALAARGLHHWSDAGADSALTPAVKAWWPEEGCPVALEIEGDDGETYERWPMSRPGLPLSDYLAEYPSDEDALRDWFAWDARRRERDEAIAGVRLALEAMGRVRRLQVLQQVVSDLDREMPGFVAACVESHLARPHQGCSRAEHDAAGM